MCRRGPTIERPSATVRISRNLFSACRSGSTFPAGRSVLDALQLPTPEGFEGLDLFTTGAGAVEPAGRPAFATLGSRYSLRLGDLALLGTAGKTPTLCELSSDPN